MVKILYIEDDEAVNKIYKIENLPKIDIIIEILYISLVHNIDKVVINVLIIEVQN